MKKCHVWGDLSSDSASENYPTVCIHDSCVQKENEKCEESSIVAVLSDDADVTHSEYEHKCYICGEAF